MRFRNRIYQFMQGRNGIDALAKHVNRLSFICLFTAIAFTFLSTLFLRRGNSGAAEVFRILYYVFYGIGVCMFVYWGFRVFSRNVAKRQSENTRYLYRRQKAARRISGLKQRWKDRKTYKYFKCSKCGQKMRAPRGKGKIRVTCSKCKNVFITKT